MQAPLPLQQYSVIQTGDLDEARESIARYFWRHRLEAEGSCSRFDARLHHAPLDSASLNFVRYGADLNVDAGEPPSCYMIKLVLGGRLQARRGKRVLEAGPGDFIITGPDQYLDLRFGEKTDLLVLKAPHDRFDQRVEAQDGAAGWARHFDDNVYGAKGSLSSFRRALMLLREEFDADQSIVASPVARSDYEEFLTGLFLQAWPSEKRARSGPATEPLAVRRAKNFLYAKRFEDVRISDVAAASGIGESAFHAAFVRTVGQSPLKYLRQLRLDAARDCLQNPDDGRSVTQVALDCGFGHLGRFSDYYKKAFGELPVEARRRSMH